MTEVKVHMATTPDGRMLTGSTNSITTVLQERAMHKQHITSEMQLVYTAYLVQHM